MWKARSHGKLRQHETGIYLWQRIDSLATNECVHMRAASAPASEVKALIPQKIAGKLPL